MCCLYIAEGIFLSIQAQDFIEESADAQAVVTNAGIPEHSSSGLH